MDESLWVLTIVGVLALFVLGIMVGADYTSERIVEHCMYDQEFQDNGRTYTCQWKGK